MHLSKLHAKPSIMGPIITMSWPPNASTTPQNDHIPMEHEDDGITTTITSMTIYQHHGRVAQRFFQMLNSEKPEQQQRVLIWPLDVNVLTTKTLDELPILPNRELPEYQLMQEWFERVVKE